MSRPSDFSFEMPAELPLDDAIPAWFAEEVRFAVSGPPPVPSAALAGALKAGFSHPTEKGDLLVTAASNVHGPAPQAAGLPKEERDMPFTGGTLAGLLAKLSGVGTAAKAALAGATAVATMGLAGGAAGILPSPAQNLVATAVNAATPFEFPAAGPVTGAVDHAAAALSHVPTTVTVPSIPPVSVATSAKAGSAGASASAGASTPAPTGAPLAAPGLPGVPPLPQVTVPPAVAGLVKGLPACVTNLIPIGGGTPDPTKLAAQIPGCISQVLATAGLPPQVATCVSSILGGIGGANGMSPGSVPKLSSLNVSSCVPFDASKCVTNMLGLLGTLPGASGGIPGLSSVTGCVPMNVTACLTSLTNAASAGAVSPGSVPKLDLSACIPAVTPTGLPGLGSLPGLGGALPFFGR